jgi:hypothetical protein
MNSVQKWPGTSLHPAMTALFQLITGCIVRGTTLDTLIKDLDIGADKYMV